MTEGGGGARAVAAALLVGVLVAYAAMLGRLRRYERSLPGEPPWWFGYARDGVNLGGAALLVAGFAAAGYPGPQALLLGLSLELGAYSVDAATGHLLGWKRSAWTVVMASGGAAVCLALASPAVSVMLARALAGVMPPR